VSDEAHTTKRAGAKRYSDVEIIQTYGRRESSYLLVGHLNKYIDPDTLQQI
jgi:hypothetical protein